MIIQVVLSIFAFFVLRLLNQTIFKENFLTFEIVAWNSVISLLRKLPNLVRTSLCQESYFRLTLDCTCNSIQKFIGYYWVTKKYWLFIIVTVPFPFQLIKWNKILKRILLQEKSPLKNSLKHVHKMQNINNRNILYRFDWLIWFLVLMPLSTIFQLYHGGQF